MIKYPQFVYGLLTSIPGVARLFRGGAGQTLSARYCYSVWMRHLVLAFDQGLDQHPRVVAELGPGNSLGVGLAALLSGAERYLAFDVVADASPRQNLRVLDELIALFRARASIPADDEFADIHPKLSSYAFPAFLSDVVMNAALADDRLAQIRRSIETPGGDAMIDYRAPWFDDRKIEENAIDMVLSQAVLEHADGLGDAYRAMSRWLRPAGLMSHQIDFRCHGTAREWNGHWTFSDFTWRLIKGRRPYMLNREPYSTHLSLLSANGFAVTGHQLCRSTSALDRGRLAPRFQSLTDDDLITSSAFIQARKM